MTDKVIKDLKQLKHCLTKKCDITCSYYNEEDMICPCSYDVPSDVAIDNAIQTIRKLQELNKGLSETNTSNPMYEIGYKKGATDMEKAKQIIIDKLQEQIPKWHLVTDELPSVSSSYIVACIKGEGLIDVTFATFQSKYKKWNMTGSRAYWKVIAWMELPKFGEVE